MVSEYCTVDRSSSETHFEVGRIYRHWICLVGVMKDVEPNRRKGNQRKGDVLKSWLRKHRFIVMSTVSVADYLAMRTHFSSHGNPAVPARVSQ